MTMSRPPVGIAVLAAVVAGTLGWIGVGVIGFELAAASPSNLAFDLDLLLKAGREIATGGSPYAPELVSGSAPTATHLFYSYPPPVAQAMAIVAFLPSSLALVGWGLIAVAGLLAVTERLRRHYAPGRSRFAVLTVTAAVAPLTLPLAVGLLFGNYDVLFPVLYGAMLLAAIAPTRPSAFVGGAALVVASLKIHPASMGLWFLVRALRERRRDGYQGGSAHVLAAAIGIGLVVIALSVLLGGPGLWADYAQVIRAGTRAVVVDPRNAGIAALVAGPIGGGDELARMLHLVVGAAALAATAWAAWRRSDPVESFAWATAASLATLPVTWYHYPGAMLPIAVASMLRASGRDVRGVSLLVTAGAVVAALALIWLPLLWFAIGLIVAAARASAPAPEPMPARTPAPATG